MQAHSASIAQQLFRHRHLEQPTVLGFWEGSFCFGGLWWVHFLWFFWFCFFFGFGFGLGASDESIFFVFLVLFFLVLVLVWGPLLSPFSLVFLVLVLFWGPLMSPFSLFFFGFGFGLGASDGYIFFGFFGFNFVWFWSLWLIHFFVLVCKCLVCKMINRTHPKKNTFFHFFHKIYNIFISQILVCSHFFGFTVTLEMFLQKQFPLLGSGIPYHTTAYSCTVI